MTPEQYVDRGGKKLRLGFTTGTCAALAARAAARMLLGGCVETGSSLVTPRGIRVDAPLIDANIAPDSASCAVRKDAGDDPDCTDGVLVYATAAKQALPGVVIDGGAGVGRITRAGLDQPVGAAAINRVPRMMIRDAVLDVCGEFGYAGGMQVTISVPDGERIAGNTFNPRLGIVGGISIIGTSGIVEPMSDQAVADAVGAEMKMLRAEGAADLLLTPGNYGEAFILSRPELAERPHVKCANHIGDAIDTAARLAFDSVIVAGHAGKIVKLSGGVMNTHSRVADCRMELLALHAGLAGADAALLRDILGAATVDSGLDMLAANGILDAAMRSMLRRIDRYLEQRCGGAFPVGAILFSNHSGLAWTSERAEAILTKWNSANEQG